jgi:SH3-like domain-containing protein
MNWKLNSVFGILFFALSIITPGAGFSEGAQDSISASESGLPLPRFVALKSEEVNLRQGPGIRYPIKWIYKREGLPVEVIEEFENWRKIRDFDGEEGWVYKAMLDGRRRVMVKGAEATILRRPEENSEALLRLEPGVISEIRECKMSWCKVEIADLKGWVKRDNLYGVYPNEDEF